MATVTVSSLSEFLNAIQVEGDTVICPESEVWDFAYISESSYLIRIQCDEINGNGTIIKNLKGAIVYELQSKTPFIHDLHFHDFLFIRGETSNDYLFIYTYSFIKFESCSFTGYLSNDAVFSNDNQYDKCSFKLEAGGNFQFLGSGLLTYSRFEIHASRAQNDMLPSLLEFYFCECILYMPNQTVIHSYRFNGCTLRGDLTGITHEDAQGQSTANTVFCVESFPDGFVPQGSNFIGVTDAQMRNPAYLQSVGFPIGVG